MGKLALIKHQRYAHAKQFKRANKALRKLKTYLGRTIRDIGRQIAGGAISRRSSSGLCIWQVGCSTRAVIREAARSIAFMPRRSNASAREKRRRLTSLA